MVDCITIPTTVAFVGLFILSVLSLWGSKIVISKYWISSTNTFTFCGKSGVAAFIVNSILCIAISFGIIGIFYSIIGIIMYLGIFETTITWLNALWLSIPCVKFV